MTKRIHLISGPRNISTAMMYSFAQRPNCRVIDEPLYACYLAETGINHPGREEVLVSQSQEREHVFSDVFFGEYDASEMFIKNMAHHLRMEDFPMLAKLSNFFLIRHPARIIASYARVIEEFSLDDLGLKQQQDMATYMLDHEMVPLVVDTGNLIKNPEEYMRALCDALQIPFYNSMLEWQPGPRAEDGVWAKHWYANVHQSSGLKPKQEQEIQLERKYIPLLNEALPYYNFLKQFEIKS